MSSTRWPYRLRRSWGPAALGLLLASLLALPGAALPAPAEDARQTLSEALDRVVAVLHNPELSHQDRRAEIESIAYERFDFDLMARLVLARNLRRLSEEQRTEFVGEFKQLLGSTYGRRLETFSNEQLELGEARLEKNGDVTVKTNVVGGAAGDGVSIDYRMKPRDDSWYVIDVTIEGVSLIQNFRSQVTEIVGTAGVDQLIVLLREKNEKQEAAAEP